MATARLTVTEDFPTPPLPLATAKTLVSEPDLVIDDGNRNTVPSTLVNCRLVPPLVERVGAVPEEEIEAILR